MTTISWGDLVAPGRVALVLQEVQEGVVGRSSVMPALAESGERVGMIGHIAELAGAARARGVPVVHCTAENLPGGFGTNHNARLFAGARKAGAENLPGTASVQPVAGVGPEAGDVVLPRYHGLSPLTGAQLDSLLRNEGVSTLIVVGVSLNVAIPNLVFDAVNRSYQVVVPTDCVAGVPPEYGDQVLQHTLHLVATLTTTADILDAWADAPPPQAGARS
jgi:nicotinamidase-related amidase